MKLLYKPVGLLINWLYGVLAGAIVNRVWTSATRADDARRQPTRSGAGSPSRCAHTRPGSAPAAAQMGEWQHPPDPGAPRLPAAQDPGGTSPARS
jgi:hypothetical protein